MMRGGFPADEQALRDLGVRQTEADQWDHTLTSSTRVPAEPIHRVQQERFEVLAGTARVRCGRDSFDLHEGECVVIPAGTRHGLRNDTDEQVTVRCQLRPAMRTADYFELVCALAMQGKVSHRGIPSPVRSAIILVERSSRIICSECRS